MAGSAWSRLTAKGKARLRKSGVIPASYNAYAKKSREDKRKIDRADYIRGRTPQQQRKRQGRVKRLDDKRKAVFDHMMSVLLGRAGRKTLTKSVGIMTPKELDFAIDADYAAIADKAREPPDKKRGWNPFWYR